MGALVSVPALVVSLDRRSEFELPHDVNLHYHGKEFRVFRGRGNRRAEDQRSIRLARIDGTQIEFAPGSSNLGAKLIAVYAQIQWLLQTSRPILLDAAVGLELWRTGTLERLYEKRKVDGVVFAGTIFRNMLDRDLSNKNLWCLYFYRDVRGDWHHNMTHLVDLRYHPYPIATLALSSCPP